jgi:sugar phosphate isomerase/epimerase
MDSTPITRRDALGKAAIGALLLPLSGSLSPLRAEAPAAPKAPSRLFTLGLAGYTMRKMSAEQAIAMMKGLGITSTALFKTHLPILIGTPDSCRDMAAMFRAAGITIAGTGVVQLANSEATMRRAFECARAAGLSVMTASYAAPPDRDTLLLTERFVREYDIRLAFHNHGPEDATFPSPYDVWRAVAPYDERLGLCIDVGHSARAGADPVAAIRDCRARLYDVHLKDTVAPVGAKKDQPVGLGFGRLDIRGILAALLEVGYRYQVGLEDEVDSPDTVPGIAQSFGYMRGVTAALTAGS